VGHRGCDTSCRSLSGHCGYKLLLLIDTCSVIRLLPHTSHNNNPQALAASRLELDQAWEKLASEREALVAQCRAVEEQQAAVEERSREAD